MKYINIHSNLALIRGIMEAVTSFKAYALQRFRQMFSTTVGEEKEYRENGESEVVVVQQQ